MSDALCKSGRRTKYSVLSNKNHTFERINAASVTCLSFLFFVSFWSVKALNGGVD